MIFRRVANSLRAQNWANVAIELAIVILGVFIGIQAANWNEERLQKRQTEELLAQLDGEMENFVGYIDSVREYYASAGHYADVAIAAWGNPSFVDDEQFVIAAYQASQVTGIGTNSNVWSAIFGAENLRDIEDRQTREAVAAVMTFDYALTDLRSVASKYREEVRKTIPDAVQAAIRQHCGDRNVGRGVLILPPKCDLNLPPEVSALTAAALRERPELLSELHWHRAAVANQLAQGSILQANARELAQRVGD